MPNKLRTRSGKEVVKFLEKNGFVVRDTHGSHTKLQRMMSEHTQTLVVPLHGEIARGTL